jgi:very-short-patch-repair endonuclease
MELAELKQWIKDRLYIKTGMQISPARCKKEWFERFECLEQYDALVKASSFLSEDAKIPERVYCALSDLKERPKCKICGKELEYDKPSIGYGIYCSRKCMNSDPDVVAKRSATNVEKYGSTCSLNNPEVKKKAVATWERELGVSHPFQSEAFKEKSKKTMQERHGYDNPGQKNVSIDSREKLLNKEWLYNEIVTKARMVKVVADELEVTPGAVRWHLKKFGIKEPSVFRYTSAVEQIVFDRIKVLNKEITIKKNYRYVVGPHEMDLYFPDFKFAVEFDGIFYHSYHELETKEEQEYHLKKTEACEKHGIHLFHVFENEWLRNKNAVLSMIFDKLGLTEDVAVLDEYDIKEISDESAIEFYTKNSVLSVKKSNLNIGLIQNNEILAVMSFSNKKDWILDGYCKKIFTVIDQCEEILLNYFISNFSPDSILVYEDRRYSNGEVPRRLGFDYLENTAVDYHVIKSNKIKDEPMTTLAQKLENYNSELSDIQNLFNNNYRRIWDCGKMIFQWERK